MWKPIVLIVLSMIRNQGKTKTIPHTVFETFIINNSRYKTQEVSWWVLWFGDARNIHKNFFYWKLLLELEVGYSGSFKCYKMFSLKMKKKNHHKDGSHLKSNKNSSHGKRHKKDIEKVEWIKKRKV